MKKNGLRTGILGALALLSFAALGLGACVGAPESSDPESSQEQAQNADDQVGEAAEAVSVGGTCNGWQGLTCDTGLNCCGSPPFNIVGTCRNLSNDGLNCGACGHQCPQNPNIPGHPRICIGGQCY